ncbi:hypothetical protein [Verrucomicrobium sp. BvORR034]|uniref:hypothetical protein n=1 Tax=Verrucomicrobium sp. BvORR034 TaxID=1396418 RepID=UPI000678B31C|nr:hypothetical protein [Verrucomicrobium sp. BvORR034]
MNVLATVTVSLLTLWVTLGAMMSTRSYAGPVPYKANRSTPAAPRATASSNDETGSYACYFLNDPLSALAVHHDPRLIVPNDGLCGWGAIDTPGFPTGIPCQFAANFDEVCMRPGLVALWPVFMEQYGGLWFEGLDEVEDDTLPSFPPPRVWIGQEDFGRHRSFLPGHEPRLLPGLVD